MTKNTPDNYRETMEESIANTKIFIKEIASLKVCIKAVFFCIFVFCIKFHLNIVK